MSYTLNALVVQRTANREQALAGSGFHSKHDRLSTVSGCWKMDRDRAASCAYLLVATGGVVVDVARVLDAEVIPERWTRVTEQEAAEGLNATDPGRVLVVTSPNVPPAIESLIGKSVPTGRNPIRYVGVSISGEAAEIVATDDDDTGSDDRMGDMAVAARHVLIEVARDRTTINYGTLAERIQEMTGHTETRPLPHWIGKVLYQVAKINHDKGEPFLAGLVTRASGEVGGGYSGIEDFLKEPIGDPEEHAAVMRVRCYRHYAAPEYEQG
jgi:hypothetical protein